MSKNKKMKNLSKYRRKRALGIKGQGWVSGPDQQDSPSPHEITYCHYPVNTSRPKKILLKSGKTAWISTDEEGKIKVL